MAKRRKPQPLVITTHEQAVKVMEALARNQRDLEAIETKMNVAIDAAKARAKDAAVSLVVSDKLQEQALANYAQLEKAKLFKERKSVETPFGLFGFRKSTKLLPRGKLTLKNVLKKLKEYGFTEAINPGTESVNKDAMADWPSDRLEQVCMRRKEKDDFYIEVKTEGLGQ